MLLNNIFLILFNIANLTLYAFFWPISVPYFMYDTFKKSNEEHSAIIELRIQNKENYLQKMLLQYPDLRYLRDSNLTYKERNEFRDRFFNTIPFTTGGLIFEVKPPRRNFGGATPAAWRDMKYRNNCISTIEKIIPEYYSKYDPKYNIIGFSLLKYSRYECIYVELIC